MSVGFRESQRAVGLLREIRNVVETGYRKRALQRIPHLVLLDPDFYHVNTVCKESLSCLGLHVGSFETFGCGMDPSMA